MGNTKTTTKVAFSTKGGELALQSSKALYIEPT